MDVCSRTGLLPEIYTQHLQDSCFKVNSLLFLKLPNRFMEELSRASGRVLLEHTTVIAGRGLRIRDRAKLEFQPRHMARHRCRWKDAQWWDSRLKKPWKNSKKGKLWKCSCQCVDLLHHIGGIEGVWLPKFSWELPPVFSVLRSLDLRSSAAAAAGRHFFEANSHFKFD